MKVGPPAPKPPKKDLNYFQMKTKVGPPTLKPPKNDSISQ
ncbi:uncharacterized protein G2W53_003887 [Senna tora]|uniref:Uncharacterized protein n=1 Tax=Senna tora TaxID=362788 RepID=A0A835CGT5_9FABA|nr:uncharacterized protein G2W53_003887 [Senna tora]